MVPNIKVNGKRIREMGMVFRLGLMDRIMKELGKMGRGMAKEHIFGQMDLVIMGLGLMIKEMEKVF